jgi:hypothetical protein
MAVVRTPRDQKIPAQTSQGYKLTASSLRLIEPTGYQNDRDSSRSNIDPMVIDL